VTEAIVNAVAHRDYTTNASVQVMLFADRLEVWNPGELPPALTPERLREPHASIPHNPLMAEPLYLVRYIEKAGSGTLDMIERCGKAGLPAPDFEERGGQFVVTLWRDWLTAEVMDRLGLNDRQLLCVKTLKVERQTTTMAYQNLVGCSRRTAARDLDELLNKGIVQRQGAGRSARYVLVRNRAINLPSVPSAADEVSPDPDAGNRVINVPNVPSQETPGAKPVEGKSKKGS
jgi:ATP-dependent DNA helicase RecG